MTGVRVLLLLATFIPPAALVATGHPWIALILLALLHLPILWGTLSPHSAMFGPVLRRVPSQRQVWLTIDDGPSADTRAMLDLLDHHDAKATFFLVAARAQQHPQLVEAIRSRGHDIGNHSTTHPAQWFWALPPARMAAEIEQAQQTLTHLTGQPPRWFRAVAGHANPFVAPVLKRLGLSRVSWSARGYDGVSGDPQAVIRRIARNLDDGAIVLLHEGARHGRSVEILARVLELLDARGFKARLHFTDAAPRSASC